MTAQQVSSILRSNVRLRVLDEGALGMRLGRDDQSRENEEVEVGGTLRSRGLYVT